jgi:hypothetical protein
MRAGGLGRGLNTLMDRPCTSPGVASDRSGVQLFLEKQTPVVSAAKPVPSTPKARGFLSSSLWVLDALLILTSLSLLVIPGLDRLVTLVLGGWLIFLAAGVGVWAVIYRR